MGKYIVKIEIEAQSVDEVKTVGCAVQNAVNNLQHDDLVKLIGAAIKKPSLVKTALSFVK